MKNSLQLVAFVFAMFTAFGAAAADLSADRDAAKSIVKAYAKNLQGTLKQALAEGGPVKGIDVCHTQAPELTAEAAADGWTVARTSLKVRNLDNAPDLWELQTLTQFERQLGEGADPASLVEMKLIEEDGTRVLRFMKAIPTGEVCLQCHGENLDQDVTQALDARYPYDLARGFKAGELRGAFTLQKRL